MRCRTFLFVLSTLLGVVSAEAQNVGGRIIGVVLDESGAVLPGVNAVLTSPALPGGPSNTVTSAQGEYRFTGLQPGIYALTVTLQGFSTYQESDLRVVAGGTVERNLHLKVAAVAETITVSGQAPVVDSRQTGITQALSSEVTQNVPHKRYGVQSFMATMPGVTTTNYNSPFQVYVMGSNQNETSFLMDGVMSNHPNTGGAWTLSDFDGLEEVNVTTLGASAEFQQAQGGVLNAIGKSGTNRFQADAAAFWAPNWLSSSPVKLPCNCPEGENGFEWLKFRDVSGHIGGPIKKNNAWFFGGLVFRGNLARNPGQAPLEKEYLVWLEDTNVKGTWKINESTTFRQTYYHERFWEPLPHSPTQTVTLDALQNSSGYLPQLGSEVATTLGSNTLLTVRYSLTNFPDKRIGFNDETTTPMRLDAVTGVQCCNALAYRSFPRRDEVDAKLNRYFSRSSFSQNVSGGVQFMRNSFAQYDIQPGGVLYTDVNGQPDQATFIPPSTQAAMYNARALWVEDEVTVNRRLTFKVGVRYDYMKGVSPDVAAFDNNLEETGETIQGLGEMFKWHTFSPRAGVNVKLTNDDKTVLRGTVGRYYRPIILSDFTGVYPGVSTQDLYRYNQATRQYDIFISSVSPNANLAVDSNMDAPYTDQYSVGIDRELVRQVAFGASYVHKNARNQIGWVDIGGVYGTATTTVSVFGQPQQLTVHPLLNSPAARVYQRTNGPGFYSQYDGAIFTLTKRHSNRWMGTLGYTYSRTKGLQPTGNLGRDPNDLTNLDGYLDPQDRPHMFNMFGSYEIPKVEVQVSGQLAVVSGVPYAPQVLVRLPQGNRSINVDDPGAYRTGTENWLQFRVTKILFRQGTRRVEVTGEVRNALQNLDSRSLVTRNVASPDFGKYSVWPDPRQMLFLAKVFF